jgi:CubicO group peptidase (beta-lactamase class C family)
MTRDTLFWVASVTKPITAAAVLLLVEEGKVGLDDPLDQHLPEFSDPWLIADGDETRRLLVRPQQKPAIRHLLTHTHGLQDSPKAEPGVPLSSWVKACALLPMVREPGSAWEYTGVGMSCLGRVVEVVSGMPFDAFLEEHFFKPLGMTDTTFFPSEEQRQRLATTYTLSDGEGLEPFPINFLTAEVGSRECMVMPHGGLFSTADDLFRFYQMLLNKGEFGGHRYLKAETVEDMIRTHTRDLKTGFREGKDKVSWGLGIWRVNEQDDVCDVLTPGSFGHDGAYGNSLLCDPENALIMILMIQRKGLNPMQDAVSFRYEFHKFTMSEFSS